MASDIMLERDDSPVADGLAFDDTSSRTSTAATASATTQPTPEAPYASTFPR